ncbi:AMP-binding protein [Oceanobacillus sp. CAU 1775]
MQGLKRKSATNFLELVEEAANQWGDKYGLIFDETDEKITFNEINARVKELSAILSNQGIVQGNKVALMLPNVPEFPLTWLAIGSIGATMIPMNIRYQFFDASYVLSNSETSLVITVSEKVDMLHTIREEEQLAFRIITIDEPHLHANAYLPDLLNFKLDRPTDIKVYPETLVNIQYTSGTTGNPKGCMLSQNYWLTIGKKFSDSSFSEFDQNDVLLTAQPYYYMDPQWNTIAALSTGATLVVLDRFSPSSFFEKIRKHKATFFYCLGSMPALLLKMPKSEEDRNHSLRLVGCSAIPSGLHEQLEERWGVKWYEIFGMTETGYDLSMTEEEHDHYIGKGSLGRPAEGREVRVVDDKDRPVKRGAVGELVLRGTGMMDGYFKNEEATMEAFKNGWFHTGDLVRQDEDGIFYYVSRKKDMIRRSGENISSAEVETTILKHNVVKMAACVPVEDEIRGEEVKVYLVFNEEVSDEESQIKELIAHCEQNLAAFKIPRYWEVKKDLPLTPSERVAKHLLIKEKADLRLDSYDRVEEIWRTEK